MRLLERNVCSLENVNFDELLQEYRSIWNNRKLNAEGNTSKEILMEAIKRELLDENTHPRVRKGIYEKYFTASKRIIQSVLSQETKLLLLDLHLKVLKDINKE